MLIRFGFKNFGPYLESADFDMRTVSAYKEHPDNIYHTNAGFDLLKVASIYGANASGKSSFIHAYNAFLQIVLTSFTSNGKDRNDKSHLNEFYRPFLFVNVSSPKNDTEFEIELLTAESIFRYGFSYNSEKIVSEWLYQIPLSTNRQRVLIERSSEIVLGTSVRKYSKYVADIDRDTLVLSFLSGLNSEKNLFSELTESITSIIPLYSGLFDIEESIRRLPLDSDEAFLKDLNNFIRAIDVQIKGVVIEKNNDNIELFTIHSCHDGSEKQVRLSIESDGTKQAIALFVFIRIAFNAGLTLLIDELNLELHPLLVKYIVDMFYLNNTSAQLIYTTHDITLLDKKYMRRDQVWFTEKNESGVAHLFSLAEFKLRNDKTFSFDYLGGAFGAIPVFKDFEMVTNNGNR